MEPIQELFNSLESFNSEAAEEAKKKFRELFNSTKESWLLNGMFDYYLSCGSERSIDVLIGVREPHDRYLFDRLSDTLRGPNRLSGLTLLGHVARRHPSWIYKIASHSVFRDLIRILKSEKDVVTLMSALLIVVILLPMIASLISPHLQDLFEIFSHLAIWKTNNPHKVPEGYLLHVEIGLYALFNRLYGMFPCNFLSYLRQHYNSKESLPVFTHTIKPMLDTVRMHPLLVTASKELEVSANRWKKIEANDVIIECAKFTIEGNYDRQHEDYSYRRNSSTLQSRSRLMISTCSSFETKLTTEGYVELGNHGVPVVGSYSANLPEPAEIWSPAIAFGAITPPGDSSIPHTPVIQGCVISAYVPQEGNSPPEAAIEATPESTPIKDMHEHGERAHSAASSSVVRSLSTFHSQPSSPLRKDHSTFKLSSTPTGLHRVHRVLSERNQVENLHTKSKASYPPGSPLRMIPLVDRGRPHTPGDRSDEDREVETTMTTSPNSCSRQVKREDSVLGDSTSGGTSDGVEWREWKAGGGLRLPECRSVNNFARRLRCYSQCQPETLHLLSLRVSCGNSPKESKKKYLRRTISCPEISKPLEDGKNEAHIEAEVLSKKIEKTFVSSGTQTDPLQPLIYEHLLLSVLNPVEPLQQRSAPPDVTSPPIFREDHPKGPLELYLKVTKEQLKERHSKSGIEFSEVKQLKDQLVLLTLQLQFERHRREVHAERNRRLLGRYRENRVLEEHNSALRDQVTLLQRETEMLHKNLERFRNEAKEEEEQHRRSIAFWEEQNLTLRNKLKDATELVKQLKEDLKEDRRKREIIAKGYAELESEVFDLRNMKKDAILAVQRAAEMKAELANLQHHLVSAGELELRLKSWIDDLLLTANADEQARMKMNAYEHKIAELSRKVHADSMKIDVAAEKLRQAEELYTKREQLAFEQKKIIEDIRSDCDEQIKVNAIRKRG
ncbi:hamartin isoform X2 [Halyomorpha halys]|uniref:hamartin isoform X2 n=1 Tax=Halyomorpha halys TaxID=286706 RepID=UPI0006D4E200|nr:hamartin isoform X2 [Halyomorpha halys]